MRRVGYIDAKTDKSYGMCANVLKQCQDYTYEIKGSNKKYLVNNEVIRQYLALALTKIKLKQDTILADYAETCWNDVYSCLSANSYDENNINTKSLSVSEIMLSNVNLLLMLDIEIGNTVRFANFGEMGILPITKNNEIILN